MSTANVAVQLCRPVKAPLLLIRSVRTPIPVFPIREALPGNARPRRYGGLTMLLTKTTATGRESCCTASGELRWLDRYVATEGVGQTTCGN
jgi:hypothetical protein